MGALTCDRCGSPVETMFIQPKGVRAGGLLQAEPIRTGYRCTNRDCQRQHGFPMGWLPTSAG